MFASLRLFVNPDLDEALRAIALARELAPGRDDYVVVHAEVLTRRKEYPAARKLLEPIAAGTRWPGLREWAQAALGRINAADRLR